MFMNELAAMDEPHRKSNAEGMKTQELAFIVILAFKILRVVEKSFVTFDAFSTFSTICAERSWRND